MDFIKHYYGEFSKEIKRELRRFVISYVKKNYKVVLPLGIGHPMHYFVRQSAFDLGTLFYRDFPHSYKKRSDNEMSLVYDEFKLFLEVGSVLTNELKIDLIKKFYKTQSSLLFFEKRYFDKNLKEEFYIKSR